MNARIRLALYYFDGMAVRIMIDFSIFLTAEAWISLLTLTFLEIVLGVDNIVFIALTTARLPREQQHIGRKLGLAGAMCMRILFLCFASWLVHLSYTLFTLDISAYHHDFSVRDLVLGLGGAYLIYKSISEMREMMVHPDTSTGEDFEAPEERQIALPAAVGTIMVMDIVFSIDSVITAVGLAEHLLVMIIAVMVAVCMMMLFIDQISTFVNRHVEMKVLAIFFIGVIGILLVLDAFGIGTGMKMLEMSIEKLMVYFAMLFSLVVVFLIIAYKKRMEAVQSLIGDED